MASEITNERAIFGDDPLSATRFLYQIIFYVPICGLLSMFGIAANIANIVVFSKQGLKDSTTVSLFALAISDLLCLIFSLWSAILFIIIAMETRTSFDKMDIMYMVGMAQQAFSRLTCIITAFITFERCMCVYAPLKVKTFITTFRTKVILAALFLIDFSVFLPFYFVNKLEWQFKSDINMTLLSLAPQDNQEEVEKITFLIHSVGMGTACCLIVIICTVIFVVQLNEKTKWRQSHASRHGSEMGAISVKEKKVVKMITLIAIIFIICHFPALLGFCFMGLDPEFNVTGKYEETLYYVWGIIYTLSTTNSAVNIFVYYKMSTKYALTFLETFCRIVKNEENSIQSLN